MTIELFGFRSTSSPSALESVNGLKITIGQPLSGAAFSSVTYAPDNAAFSYLGGERRVLGTTFPLDHFVGTFNVTYDNGVSTGIGGVLEFSTDAQSFDLLTYSAGFLAQFDVFVDGKLLRGASVSLVPDGSLRNITVDYSAAGFAPGFHEVEIAYNGPTYFGGLTLHGGSILASSDPGPRIVVLGDSFTEGTGAADASQGFAKLLGKFLGTADVWSSGEGGTGYEAVIPGRPNLLSRIGPDGIDAHADVYIVAMGLNDSDTSQTLYAAVMDTITQLRSGAPNARIFVLGPWNPGAPTGETKPLVADAIEAAVGSIQGVTYLDPSTIPFSKSDTTHPDQAGHQVLAQWLAAQVRGAMGTDGVIEQGVAGDVVGPLFVGSWTPGAQMAYSVLENGLPSTRFEVVDNGDAFPTLRLKAGVAVNTLGSISVEICTADQAGHVDIQTIAFGVREHLAGTDAADVLAGHGLGVSIDAGAGNDSLTGTSGLDALYGGSGNDWLAGAPGADVMAGGSGNDAYSVESLDDIVREAAGEGDDLIYTALDQYMLPANVERLTLVGDARDAGGNDLANVIQGNASANTLYGAGGDDYLDGGAGDDRLVGASGDDWLLGGAGSDQLAGGPGDDIYLITDEADAILESVDGGIDAAWSYLASYVLPANVEKLLLMGGESIAGTGNDSGNLLIGNALDNVLDGAGGIDYIDGGAGNDQLIGGSGDDWLLGGAGADHLAGGVGDDIYLVTDNVDTTVESPDEGVDAAWSYLASFVLPANVEKLILVGDGSIAGTGNDSGNLLIGNALDNVLDGASGIDYIDGGAGNDQLIGGGGDDWLLGGAGSDQMAGGSGDDIYLVTDNVDTTVESPDEGVDAAWSYLASFVLPANVEKLILVGGGSIAGTGNDSGNLLIGNALDNVLDGAGGIDYIDGGAGNDQLIGGGGDDWLLGGAGSDQMAGGIGDDTYLITDSGDSIAEGIGEGVDAIWSYLASYALPSNVEKLLLMGSSSISGTGNDTGNLLIGNALGNVLDGGGGEDYLDGGAGDDQLTGGSGVDWLIGGSGTDVVIYDKSIAAFMYQFASNGFLTVTDSASGDRDYLSGDEQIWFGADHYAINWDLQVFTLMP